MFSFGVQKKADLLFEINMAGTFYSWLTRFCLVHATAQGLHYAAYRYKRTFQPTTEYEPYDWMFPMIFANTITVWLPGVWISSLPNMFAYHGAGCAITAVSGLQLDDISRAVERQRVRREIEKIQSTEIMSPS